MTDGDLVDYSKDVPLLYACGTTPVNAMLVSALLGACTPARHIVTQRILAAQKSNPAPGAAADAASAVESGGSGGRKPNIGVVEGGGSTCTPRPTLTAVALCGGSGAELIGICSYINTVLLSQEATAANAATAAAAGAGAGAGAAGGRQSQPAQGAHAPPRAPQAPPQAPPQALVTVKVTIVDHVREWEPGILAYTAILKQQHPTIALDVEFFCCDLLSPAWGVLAPQVLPAADLVTMVYGMSELYVAPVCTVVCIERRATQELASCCIA